MTTVSSNSDGPRLVKAILKLTWRCNAKCLFCRSDADRGRVDDVPAAEVVRRLAKARDLGVGMVLFSGGEPTLRDDLPMLAKAAGALGLRFGLITNGRRLAYEAYRDAMLDLGLAYVHTSLHGARPATHNEVTQCSGFGQVLAALDGIAGKGVEVHVNTVVCRTNVDELGDLSDLLARWAPLTHKLCLMEPRGLFEQYEQRLLLPPQEAAHAAIAQIVRTRELYGPDGLQTVVEGFPLCQVEAARDAVSGLRAHGILWMSEVDDDDFHPTDDGERTFPDACAACRLRPECPGVYVGYARRFGSEGLRPRTGGPTADG